MHALASYLSACLLMTAGLISSAQASSHREAPLTALDEKVDITDFFAFVSYDNPDRMTFILAVDPLLEPSNGPNYFPFDPNVTYMIKIDQDHDAREDVRFEFQFTTEIRTPRQFTGFLGNGNGVTAPPNAPPPITRGMPLIPPAITALDGPGSEGLNLRQTYTVTLQRGRGTNAFRRVLSEGQTLFAVPANVGHRTMPDYPALVQQGIYALDGGTIRTFAGTVDDPFWSDLGAAFDTFRLRPNAFVTGIPGVLSAEQDRQNATNFAPDDLSGFNVNAIAIEVPISFVTQGRQKYGANDPRATLGTYGVTARRQTQTLSTTPGTAATVSGLLIQLQRMGNPLFNELIVGTGSKDQFSMSDPHLDSQFGSFALDPLLARVLNAIYERSFGSGTLPIPAPPRTDLLPLLTYGPPIASPNTPTGPLADLLRINTGIPPTVPASRNRLGLLAGDRAGFPNGRRLTDDVTDIMLRLVLGVLIGPPFDDPPHSRIGDGVNTNDVPYKDTFPYLGFAHSGRDSRHIDPGESGCTGVCP